MKPDEKQSVVEAEQLNIRLEGIERRLESLARSRAEAKELLISLGQLPTLKDGDGLLVPVATGLFTKARAVASDTLLVNVGDGVTVEKTVAEVRAMVEAQIKRMDEQEAHLHAQFEAGLSRLGELQQVFKG